MNLRNLERIASMSKISQNNKRSRTPSKTPEKVLNDYETALTEFYDAAIQHEEKLKQASERVLDVRKYLQP